MKLKVLTSVKYNGDWFNTGSIFECDDKTADHFMNNNAAVSVEPGTVDENIAIENLCKLDGVNKKVAQILIDANMDTVEKVSTMEVKDLTSISGIAKKTAEKIYSSFIPEK